MNAINSDGEKLRLAALNELQILDTLPEQDFDDITLLASQICETPIAAISLIDKNRQWFKSRIGLDVAETPRDCAFCDHAIKGDELFIVANAAKDARFAANPLVTNDPNIRFYAGAPLTTSEGYKLGTLCVIDNKPRELSGSQQRSLNALARSVMSLIEARNLKNIAVVSANEKTNTIFSEIEDIASKEKSFFNQHIKHYLIATVIIIVVTLIKMLLGTVAQVESPFILFACATLLASWRGGFGPGLYSTLASLLIVNYFFLSPYNSIFGHDYKQNILFSIFIGQGAFIAALCASRLRNEKLLHQAGKELENRVINRTAQLGQANSELKQEIQERSLLQEDLRQARDAALESARLKSEFLANMSHEIRTPMNGVIGMTGLLLETKLDNEQERFAQVIRNSSESLLTIINDILDFSKIEAGKFEIETLDFNLRETIESLVEMFSSRAREQKDELAALIHSDVPLCLRGDAGRIRQILTNLIGNAIKFTKFGDIMVRVEKLHETAGKVSLKISVTDNGEGISKEVQTKLFQPFTQSDASTTRRFGGTGLGLSISKKLVEMMNGEIGLESKLGKGSTFWFNLTLEKQEIAAHPDFEHSNLVQENFELRGKRALIVDDNEVNREVLMYQTRSWNMETLEASDGINAVELLEKAEKPFDLVILDLQMPILDGLETAQRILSKKIQSPPSIIMISSSGFKMEAEKMREFGIKAFLNKPYRQGDLLKAVCDTLSISENESFEVCEDEDIHITAVAETENVVQQKSKRLLIVEDNSVNQMVAQNMLKRFGYHADIAGNGFEALQALELIPYDLILMDCQMPEMDGYEATRQIRARDWDAATIPVIALTAHATAGDREKCLQAGMDDYISKPIEKENLRQTVAQWLSQSQNKNVKQHHLNENVSSNEKSATGKTEEIVIEKAAEFAFEKEEESSVPAVDFAMLDDITGNDTDLRREVVEIYLAQTVVGLSEIEQAISADDAVKLYELAHRTVSGSLICGMTAIVDPIRTLERMGKEGQTIDAAPVLAQAQKAFAAIDRECRKIL